MNEWLPEFSNYAKLLLLSSKGRGLTDPGLTGVIFIENSLAKDEVASMILCPIKAQISKSKPGRIPTDQQMQARLQQGTNFVRP